MKSSRRTSSQADQNKLGLFRIVKKYQWPAISLAIFLVLQAVKRENVRGGMVLLLPECCLLSLIPLLLKIFLKTLPLERGGGICKVFGKKLLSKSMVHC